MAAITVFTPTYNRAYCLHRCYESLCRQSCNPRLGIVGGISILGTTGIVEPMSEEALVETIRTHLNVLKAEGRKWV